MPTCCATLANITKACNESGGNAPGIKTKVWVACKDHVDTVPAAVDGVVTADIVMNLDTGEGAAGVFYEWSVSKIADGYTFEEEGEAEDGYGSHNLAFFIPKMSAAKSTVLNGTRGGAEHIIIFQDQNGKKWLMGDDDEGATMSPIPGTNDRNGYAVTANYRSSNLLYEYTGAIAVAA